MDEPVSAREDQSVVEPDAEKNAEQALFELAAVFMPGVVGGEKAAEKVYPQATPSLAAGELPRAQVLYATLVEQIPAVVFLAFLDGGSGEAYVSPQIETALGFSQQEWLSDPVRWYHQIHPADKARWSRDAADLLVSGEPLKELYRVMARDGHTVWFQCEAKMVRTKEGRPWFIHGVGFDISDLKSAEEELRRANTELETRVQDRTAELKRSNEGLQLEIAERERAQAEREKLISELQDALGQIRTLRGLLPICSFCKKIRDEQGSWQPLDSYIVSHTDAQLSHGMCAECASKHYPEFFKDEK